MTHEEAVPWASEKLNQSAWPGKEGAEWSQTAAKLVALEVVRALGRRLAVIRALIGILTIDAFVFLMVTRIYPVQPHSLLSGLSWFLLLAVVIVSARALVAMERCGSQLCLWQRAGQGHLGWFVRLALGSIGRIAPGRAGGCAFPGDRWTDIRVAATADSVGAVGSSRWTVGSPGSSNSSAGSPSRSAFFTNWAAFLDSGTMAAYVRVHWNLHFRPKFFPTVNQGKPPLLARSFCISPAAAAAGRAWITGAGVDVQTADESGFPFRQAKTARNRLLLLSV